MYEFILPTRSSGRKSTEKIHHAACHLGTDPNVAIYDPYYIAFCFTVCPTHVPDLGIGTQIAGSAIAPGEVGILFFNQDLCIKGRESG